MSLFGALGGAFIGQANENNQTPQIDMSQVNQYGQQGQADYGSQQKALDLTNQMAQGRGPSAATAMLNQQTAQTQAMNNAQASSGSGNESAGLNRRQAMMENTQATQGLGGNAAVARANEQMGAVNQAGQLAGQMRGQDLQGAGMYGQLATNQANLQEQTNQLNTAAQVANMQGNQSFMNSAMGMAAGAVGALAMADGPVEAVDLEEPGGVDARDGGMPRGWVMRELGGGIGLVNKKTGQLMMMAMRPASPKEVAELNGPHGAGPLPGRPGERPEMQVPHHRTVHRGLYAHDLGVGSSGGLQSQNVQPEGGHDPLSGVLPPTSSSGGGGASGMLGSAMSGSGGGGAEGAALAAADLDIAQPSNDAYDPEVTGAYSFPDEQQAPMRDDDFKKMLTESAAGGRDSGGNEYAVPGYKPPQNELYSGRAMTGRGDESALGFGEGPTSREDWIPRAGRFGKYSDPARGVGGGDVSEDGEDMSKGHDRSSFLRVLGGALGGFANPKGAIQMFQSRQQAKAAQPSAAPQSAPQPGPSAPQVKPPEIKKAGDLDMSDGGTADRGHNYKHDASRTAPTKDATKPQPRPARDMTGFSEAPRNFREVVPTSGHNVMQAGDVDLTSPQSAVPQDHPLAQLDAKREAHFSGQSGDVAATDSSQTPDPTFQRERAARIERQFDRPFEDSPDNSTLEAQTAAGAPKTFRKPMKGADDDPRIWGAFKQRLEEGDEPYIMPRDEGQGGPSLPNERMERMPGFVGAANPFVSEFDPDLITGDMPGSGDETRGEDAIGKPTRRINEFFSRGGKAPSADAKAKDADEKPSPLRKAFASPKRGKKLKGGKAVEA